MMKPTIHANGTSKEALAKQYEDAANALQDAVVAIRISYPNGRDYYPQGLKAIILAVEEHQRREIAVEAVLQEIIALWEHVEGVGR